MLTVEENERLTRVGPGTPMGDLMRRYWHPIAAMSQLDENGTKPIRVLGENLVLFKDLKGRLGLIAESCPHRKVNMVYGMCEDEGIRCPYHGWLSTLREDAWNSPTKRLRIPWNCSRKRRRPRLIRFRNWAA